MSSMDKPGIYLSKVIDNPNVIFLSFRLWLSTYSGNLVNLHAGAVRKSDIPNHPYLDGKISKLSNDSWINVSSKILTSGYDFVQSCGVYKDDSDGLQKWINLEHELLWDITLDPKAQDKKSKVNTRIELTGNDLIYAKSYLYLIYDTVAKFFEDFVSADPRNKNSFFKGRTLGERLENYPGLIMKSLKTGFGSVSYIKEHAYTGYKLEQFVEKDIISYVKKLSSSPELDLKSGVFVWGDRETGNYIWDFESTQIENIKSLFIKAKNLNIKEPIYNDDLKHRFDKVRTENGYNTLEDRNAARENFNYTGARNSNLIRVNAYGFRSDSRPPIQIRVDGGFHPNATRDDRRRIAELPLDHDDRKLDGFKKPRDNKDFTPITTDDLLDNLVHQSNWGSDFSGFVSFAKNPAKTLQFIPITLGRKAGFAWIYVVKCIDAIDVEESFKDPRYNEREISMAGGVDWDDVVAWRKVRYDPGSHDKYKWADDYISKQGPQ